MGQFMDLMTAATEKGLIPDSLTRAGVKRLLCQRLDSLPLGNIEEESSYVRQFVASMARSPIASFTKEANEQHYEVPSAYFDMVLGPHRKYSSCYWPAEASSLAQAEVAALAITCERARLDDGQRILELGCGWGSLSLWMAEHYPAANITAVSNSASQKQWIDDQARHRGLNNLEVVTADMNDFSAAGIYDRVVSVEMFEHMRNWPDLLARVASWLRGGGYFFMHVFCHRQLPYFFEVGEENDWMSSHFFSGGMMPSFDLPLLFQQQMAVRDRWAWSGDHYARTLRAWLERHDARKAEIMELFRGVYGADAELWFVRWRLFYIACEELFRFEQGNEWFVGHYLFEKGEHHHV